MEKIAKNKKIIIYSIIFLFFISKIISLNINRIDNFISGTRYEILVEKYHQLSSYQNFLDGKKEIQGIYFGSLECPHCVKNIRSINSILGKNEDIHYFKVDFNNHDNQVELEKFKKQFNFETIPHIVMFTKGEETQYSSRDIAEYSK